MTQISAELSVEKVQEIKNEVGLIVSKANALTITTPELYIVATDMAKTITERKKFVINEFKEPKDLAKKAHLAIVAMEAKCLEPLNEARYILDRKRIAYDEQQELIRRAKQREAEEEARKQQAKLEAQAEKKAIKAEKNGDKATAEALRQDVPQVPIPVVEKETPIIKGTSKRRMWKARIVDETKIPRKYLIPNMVAINGIAKAEKDKASIPGVEFYYEDILTERV